MAQTGFTPILLYSSSTASNAPAVGNLTNSTLGSELAINITDGKLFYKDNANAIQVIGWKVRPANAGGTGITSYAVGDLLYADTTSTLAKLADVATGNALISGGINVAPSWGKVGLTTHVSGTLPIANGGTNSTDTPTSGGVGYGTGTAHAYTAAGTSGQLLQSAGSSAPTWSSAINGVTVGQTTAAAITGTTVVANSYMANASGAIHYFNNSVNSASGRIYCPGGGSLSLTAYGSEMIRCNEDSSVDFYISSGTLQYQMSTSGFYPSADNARTLGKASNRWSTVYAGNGTINTSDANEKQQIRDLSNIEKTVALELKSKVKAFKFNEAVQKKGDGARIHFGVIAQEIEQTFQAHGLNASEYGLFCSDTWWERMEDEEQIYFDGEFDATTGQEIKKTRMVNVRKTYPDSVEGGVQKTLRGIRYEELLAFIISAM
jgi:hypothetical protein